MPQLRVRVCECVFVLGEVIYHTLEASLSQFFSLWTKLELKMSGFFFFFANVTLRNDKELQLPLDTVLIHR